MEQEQDSIGLLTVYGKVLGLGMDEMEESTIRLGTISGCDRDSSIADDVEEMALGYDPKTLWLGAVVFGYLSYMVSISQSDGAE